MKKFILLFTLILTLFLPALAQNDSCSVIADVISTYPVFPNEKGGVTIYFDATKGNGALEDYTGDVYAHTGVITEKSPDDNYWLYVVSDWGENLPKTKFTKIGDNLYQLTIDNIHDYYGVPADEKILSIAMVIRSDVAVNGSYIVARNSDGSDFHVKMYDSVINVKILKPAENQLFYPDDTIKICAYSLAADSIRLFLDGKFMASTTAGSIQTSLVADSSLAGAHKIVATVYSGVLSRSDSVHIFVIPPVETAELPGGLHNGVNILDEHTVTFVLQDPPAKKKFVILTGDFNNWTPSADYMMKRTPDGQYFWLTVSNLEPDKEYGYQYLVDGSLRLADPYSHKILDPWNDPYIPSYIYPDLKPYPTGKTYGIVSVFKTNPQQYDWQVTDFQAPDYKDLVIYELLIRDFVSSHWIVDVEEKLDYLQELGINAIELMPFSEFEGNISWGYNPDFYFAVDKYYGTPEQFKHFIDEAHKRGIAVIMDIVFNHAYYLCPLVQMYWDAQNNRPSADNPWFNPVARHPFSTGYDFNHDSPYTRQFVKDALEYWLTEYKIDGFRFDLSKGFTQNYTTDVGAWSAYDQDRIDILTGYNDFIKSINPNAYVILEHFAEDREEQVLASRGMLLWSNNTYGFQQTVMGWMDGSGFSRIFYQEHGFTQPRAVAYMESHDEERLIYKAKTWGNSNGDYNVKLLPTALEREKAALSLFLAAPGPKMIWQFGELGYDYSINYCEDGTISEECRTSPKPVHWDYYQDSVRRSLYDFYSQMINWKKTDDIFDNATYTYDLGTAVKKVKITSPAKNAYIIGNFGVTSTTYNLNFPHPGYWVDMFTGEAIYANSYNNIIELQPGEYHFWTDYYLDLRPDSLKATQEQVKIFPNPAQDYIVVDAPDGQSISIYDTSGNLIKTQEVKNNPQMILLPDLKPGIYILKVRTSGVVRTGKVIISNK